MKNKTLKKHILKSLKEEAGLWDWKETISSSVIEPSRLLLSRGPVEIMAHLNDEKYVVTRVKIRGETSSTEITLEDTYKVIENTFRHKLNKIINKLYNEKSLELFSYAIGWFEKNNG